MKDSEVWLILYQAILSTSVEYVDWSAKAADDALIEYKKRWDDAPDTDAEKQ